MLSLSPITLLLFSLGVAVLLIAAGWIVSSFRLPFRIKLTLVLALIALFPYLSLGYLLSRELTRTVNLWETPGVEEALKSSLTNARQGVEGQRAAMESEIQNCWTKHDLRKMVEAGRMEPTIENLRSCAALDFIRIYRKTPDAKWKLAGGWAAPGAKMTPAGLVEIESLLQLRNQGAKNQNMRSDASVVAVRLPADERDGTAVIAGRFADTAEVLRMKNLIGAIRVYDQMNIYKELSKRVVWIFFALSGALALLLAGLIGNHVSGRLTGPLRLLSAEMRKVGSGSFSGELKIKSGDEIEELVGSFNRMSDDLRRYERDLKRSERIAAWKDVARRIAHEIKNPLTPIRFSLQRIASRAGAPGNAENPEIQGEVRAILGQLVTLEAMASSFSSFAKIPQPKPEPFQIESLVQDVLRVNATDGVRVEFTQQKSVPAVNVDPILMRVVFNNVVKNANEAMREKGVLNVLIEMRRGGGADEGRDFLAVEFSDSGDGIPGELLDKVWYPYFTTKPAGTGLGLSISLKIVEEHGGRMEIASREKKGTTITVLLPAGSSDERSHGNSA